MSNIELGLWSFPVLLLLIFLRMPIGLSMLIVGVVGNFLITKSWNPSLALFKSLTYGSFANHSLTVVPLFLLMGQFAGMQVAGAAGPQQVTRAARGGQQQGFEQFPAIPSRDQRRKFKPAARVARA